jgi:hypothetical protein
MRSNARLGEDISMVDEPKDLNEVQRRLSEIQRRKRGGIRWNVSRHTAEMAIGALAPEILPEPTPRSGKQRRRKRAKRLL